MPKGAKYGGRTKGTPNKTTSVIRQAIESADPIGRLIEMMNTGHVVSKDGGRGEALSPTEYIRVAELLAKKICPDAKDRPVRFNMDAETNDLKSINQAMVNLVQRVSLGELTPIEGQTIMHLLTSVSKSFEVTELLERVEAIEAKMEMGA